MFEKGNRGNTIHGILLIALFSFAAFYIAEIPFVKSLSFSPLIVGIILGMLYANSLRNHLPETWVPGIKFCTKQILRAGIVLYGFRLTLTEVAAVGLPAVIIDTIIVAGTIFLGIWLGRAMKMDKDTSLMTATGSAICGAAAVLGAEPVVKCEGHKTAIAVSTVVSSTGNSHSSVCQTANDMVQRHGTAWLYHTLDRCNPPNGGKSK